MTIIWRIIVMRLKKELYAFDKGKTLAENIDTAWGIYLDEDNQTDSDREIAQEFLIFAFNINILTDINEQLITLMTERYSHKGNNPEYIPGLSPKQLNLAPEKMLPRLTLSSCKTRDIVLQSLFDSKEILDVNQVDKSTDVKAKMILFPQDRAKYRVHIYRGKFYQGAELFNTTRYKAHFKEGYAAFTLNANGELSVFKHKSMPFSLFHSSMNNGRPVVSAGELIIKNGELLAINTFSGHYKTSLFNIYRTLEYFVDKNVNVSKTKIFTMSNPGRFGLRLDHKKVTIPATDNGKGFEYYEIAASVFLKSIREKMEASLLTIKADITKYHASSLRNILYSIKDSLIGSDLTSQRKLISSQIQSFTEELINDLTDNDEENAKKLNQLIENLERAKDANTNLSASHSKNSDNGRLHKKISSFLGEAIAIRDIKSRASDSDHPKMKKVF